MTDFSTAEICLRYAAGVFGVLLTGVLITLLLAALFLRRRNGFAFRRFLSIVLIASGATLGFFLLASFFLSGLWNAGNALAMGFLFSIPAALYSAVAFPLVLILFRKRPGAVAFVPPAVALFFFVNCIAAAALDSLEVLVVWIWPLGFITTL